VTGLALTAAEQARVARIDALVAIGARGVGELVDALGDPSWTVRRAVVAGLAALGDDAVPALCAWLSRTRTSERAIAAAVDALSGSIGSTATAEVERLAVGSDAHLVEDVARILGRRAAASAVPLLCKLVEHPSDNVALAAIEALGDIGGGAGLDALIDVATRRDFFRTFPAMQVLARAGDPRAVAPLASLLADPIYAFEAVSALGRTGAVQAVSALADLVGRADVELIRAIAVALRELVARATWQGAGDHARAAIAAALGDRVQPFVAALRAADAAAREALIEMIGAIGDAGSVGVLAPMFEEPELRAAAVLAVQSIARSSDVAMAIALANDEPAIRAAALAVVGSRAFAGTVCELLGDDDAEVRARACDALARLGDVARVAALFELLGDASPRVALAATGAIHSLGSAETPRLAILALASTSPVVRRNALRVIAYVGPRAALDAVIAATGDSDARTAELAAVALAAFDDPRVDAELVALARDRREQIRGAAMRAAATRGLVELLVGGARDAAAWVRYYACQGLGGQSIAGQGGPVIETLRACLADPAPHVRIAALEAIARQPGSEAAELLRAAARSSDPDERRAALVGVGLRTGEAELALLREAVRSPDVAIRIVALPGLARRTEPDALADLAAAIDDVDVRDAALSLLADRTDPRAIDALLDALVEDRGAAIRAAVSRPSAERAAAIADRLVHGDGIAADELVAALARMATPEAIAALFAALRARAPAARRSAAVALMAIDVRGAAMAVRALAVGDPDPEVRRACAAAVSS
jgi:HEAT repeat protein